MLKHSFAYALVAVLVLWAAQERKAQPNKTSTQPKTQNANAQPIGTPIQNPSPQIDNAAEAERKRVQQNRDAKEDAFKAEQLRQNQVIASATFWMSVIAAVNLGVAIIYAVFAYKTLKAVEKESAHTGNQEVIMDKTLKVTSRAYLGLHSIDFDPKASRVVILIGNVGRLPADEIAIALRLEVVMPKRLAPYMRIDREFQPRPHQQQAFTLPFNYAYGKFKLFPSDYKIPIMLRFDRDGILTKNEINSITDGNAALTIFGNITYSDGFDSNQSTDFTLRYYLEGNMWIPQHVPYWRESPKVDEAGNEQED